MTRVQSLSDVRGTIDAATLCGYANSKLNHRLLNAFSEECLRTLRMMVFSTLTSASCILKGTATGDDGVDMPGPAHASLLLQVTVYQRIA